MDFAFLPHRNPSIETVETFACDLRKSVENLLEQLHAAGVDKSSASDPITAEDKDQLLRFLQATHGLGSTERKRITLVKRSTSHSPTTSIPPNRLPILDGSIRHPLLNYQIVRRSLKAAYDELLGTMYADGCGAFDGNAFATKYREACRRMAETLRQLRKLVAEYEPDARRCALRSHHNVVRHGGAFFNVVKVDGRNLP